MVFGVSGDAVSPIVLGAYGNGEKPVISVNWEFQGNWTRENGNIWKMADINFQPWRVRINGEEKLQAVSKSEIDGVKYFWYIETDDVPWDVKNADMYLYCEKDPDSVLIQLNATRFSFQLDHVHNVIVRDLDIQGGNDGCFSIVGCEDVRLIHVTTGAYARFGVTLSGSHDIVIDSSLVDARFEFQYTRSSLRGPGDGITTWGNVKHLEVKNSTIRTWGHNCIYFMGNDGPEDTEYNVVHDCLLEGINSYSRAFETGGSASHNEFFNNVARHFTASSQVGGTHNFFHHNIFYDYKNSPVKDYPIGQVFTFQQFEGGPDEWNRIENNVFADIDEQALNYIAGGEWNGPIRNNTFKNNILYNVGRNSWRSTEKGVVIRWPSCDSVTGENYSNNCIYNPGGEAWIIYRGKKLTVEEFNQKNGAHSDTLQNNINVDPLFVDAEHHDYHLRPGSPCIDQGLLVAGVDKDMDGNSIPYGKGPDIGAYEYHDVPFLAYDCIGTGYDGYATIPSEEPYVPEIKIDESKIIYVSPDGGGDGSSEGSPTTFATAFQQITPGTTIIALDGEYNLKVDMPAMHDVNIISKNKWGAKITWDEGNAFDMGNTRDIHHVNFIGFEAYAEKSWSFFIFAAGTAKDIGVHHIYISDMNFHDIGTCVYSGLHSHDWTIDRTIFHNSRREYLWYMMGWHQTVMNSVMYNNFYFSLSIRGHYPLDEKFDYYHPENNTPITDRDSSWLDKDDWTHLIVNNTFGSCNDASDGGSSHVVIFYNMPPEDPPGQGEDVYFPPQNVTIANNVFVDNGPIHKKPVSIFAKRGINTGEPWSVNGVYIYNNVTDKSQMLIQEDYPIESIDLSNNTVNAKNMNFQDEENFDYRLTAVSTDLIDKGSNIPFRPNNDFLRQIRDRQPDVGAYEYQGSPEDVEKITGKQNNELKIYPNPSASYIIIKIPEGVKEYQVIIYNMKGERVKTFMPMRYSMISIADLSRGFYVCRVFDMQKKTEYNGKFLVYR